DALGTSVARARLRRLGARDRGRIGGHAVGASRLARAHACERDAGADAEGALSVRRGAGVRGRARGESRRFDAVELALYESLFGSCAEEMGVTLMRTAHSPNIKERLDHSCAVFDRDGGLVAQAAHIPVHLGSV